MADWYSNHRSIDIHIERPTDTDEHWDVQLVIMAGGGPNVITFRFVERFEWNCKPGIERFESYTDSRLRRQVLIDEVIDWRCLQTAWKFVDVDELKLKIVSVCNALIHDKVPSPRVLFELNWILEHPISGNSEPGYREYRKHIERNDRTGKYELNLDYATYRKIWASARGYGRIKKK
jgi:hypothetical protein